MTGPGINVIAGVVLSLLAELHPHWDQVDSRMKRLLFFLACFIIPLASSVVGILYYHWNARFDVTVFPALVAGWMAFGGGTLAHTVKLQDTKLPMQLGQALIQIYEGACVSADKQRAPLDVVALGAQMVRMVGATFYAGK